MTENIETRAYYDQLVKIMLTTRGVRFSVAESEQRKERFSIATIALLSVYLASWSLAISIFPNFISSEQAKALGFVSVIASVSLLTISLFDFAAGRSVYAEKMLQNAFSITSILRASERELAKNNPDFDKLADLAFNYEVVVGSVGINHTSKDFRLWKLQRRQPLGRIDTIWTWLKSVTFQAIAFSSSMFFQISLLILIFTSTLGIFLML